MMHWQVVSARVPASTERRLIGDAEILAAARWRLAACTQAEIEAGRARLAQVIERGTELDGAAVEDLLCCLHRRGDRRDPWTALCAMAVLHANAHGIARLFLRAGFEVVSAWRNSKARKPGMARSPLTLMMIEYQANQPDATAADYFDLLASLAGMDPVITDYDSAADLLTYMDGDRLIDIKRDSFARQFRRAKKFADHERTQGVGVRMAA
jgi:hypothetical protein